jgi:hypothetical protein
MVSLFKFILEILKIHKNDVFKKLKNRQKNRISRSFWINSFYKLLKILEKS